MTPQAKAKEISFPYRPREWAREVHQSRAKRKVIWAHRRAGKGWCALFEGVAAYAEALAKPVEAELIPGFHAWSVAPTFPQARQTENELNVFLLPELRPPDDALGHRRDEHTFRLNGSQHRREGLWEVKSAFNPDDLQTVGLDFLHVQECQDISETAFSKLLPTISDQRRLGYAVFEGIPPSDPNHWFARMMLEALDMKAHPGRREGFSGIETFKVPYTENRDLTPETVKEIERDRNFMLEREWMRMYMVELPVGVSTALGDVRSCVQDAPMLSEALKGHRYVMGIDLGKKVDATVLIVFDAVERRVVYARRMLSMGWPVQEEAIASAARRFHAGRIRIDSTGVGDPVYDALRMAGLPMEPFLFTNESKWLLLSQLAIAIEKQTVSYPKIDEMLREMESLRPEKLPSGKTHFTSIMHDDYPMALALGLSVCDPPPQVMAAWANIKSERYAPATNLLGQEPLRPDGVGFHFRDRERMRRARERQEALMAQGVTL